MTREAEKFNDLTREFGGRYPYETEAVDEPGAAAASYFFHQFVEAQRRRLSELSSIVANEVGVKQFSIYFDIIIAREVNAVTFKMGLKSYAIGLTSGIVQGMSPLLAQIFRTKELLTDIGDITAEDRDEAFAVSRWGAIPVSPNDLDPEDGVATLEFPHNNEYQIARPRCPIRRECYYQSLCAVFDFLILHEISHMYLGHLRGNASAARLLAEATSGDVQPRRAEKLQSNELHADELAMFVLWLRWLRGELRQTQATLPDALSLRSLFIAIMCIFYVFRRRGLNDPVLYDGLSHPHPDVRLCSAILFVLKSVHASEVLGDEFKDQLSVFESIWPQIRNDVNDVRRHLWQRDVSFKGNDVGDIFEEKYYKDLIPRVSQLATLRPVNSRSERGLYKKRASAGLD